MAGATDPPDAVLPAAFFARATLEVARDLIGCVVATGRGATLTAGRIVETEAYLGEDDPASHAARGPTPRASIMFGPPGVVYVYLIYGLHHCLNFVTEPDGTAGAVLIRALAPVAGREVMAARRAAGGRPPRPSALCAGPGRLCRALGIDRTWNGEPAQGPRLRVLARRGAWPRLVATPRIGVRQAADRPWRFVAAADGTAPV
ncbi:MAG: DNA-3-methyladenine glycosylase [Candidatus Krumholzibacteriia bacterium]